MKLADIKAKLPEMPELKCPKVDLSDLKEKAFSLRDTIISIPAAARKIAAGVVTLATAACTIIYLLNKFKGNYDNSKVPTPEQVLSAKK